MGACAQAVEQLNAKTVIAKANFISKLVDANLNGCYPVISDLAVIIIIRFGDYCDTLCW